MNDYRITGPACSSASPGASRVPFAQPTRAAERQSTAAAGHARPCQPAELREYYARKNELAELGRQQGGCTAREPHAAPQERGIGRAGTVGAEFRTSLQCQITGPKLAKIIGQAEVERLKGLIGSTAQDQLWVNENS